MVRHSTEPKNQPWSCNTWKVVFRGSGSVRVLQLLESVFRIFEGTKLQLWSLLQVLTLWKAEIDWCSTITDSVAYERTSEIFPSIATRDSEFRPQWMHSTTSWNMPSVLHPTKMISADICKGKGWSSAQQDAIFHQGLSTSLRSKGKEEDSSC